MTFWASLPDFVRSTFWILVVTVALILSVAFTTLWERKVIGWMQLRKGPNRVGSIFGFLPGIFQPFADVIKLLVKEVVIPAEANKVLFRIAPMITLIPAFAIWAVIPLDPNLVIADVNAGLLYVLALTSVGVYGVILAGWASNSKYAFLGAMRSAAQIVAYEIAMGFALVGVIMAAGSLNLGDIVRGQQGGMLCVELGSGCSRCSWCISSRASPKPIARHSTWPKASRKSSPASTWNIPASRSRCSSWPNTPTCC